MDQEILLPFDKPSNNNIYNISIMNIITMKIFCLLLNVFII